jgi:hypothetical protein
MLHVILPYRDRQGFERLMIKRARSPRGGIAHFGGIVEAREWLFALARNRDLDPALLGLGGGTDAPERTPAVHNALLREGIKELLLPVFPAHAFCLLRGRTSDEAGVIHVQGGRFAGLGWLEGGVRSSTPFEVLVDSVASASRSGLTDAVMKEAFLEPENAGERLVWLCFDEFGMPVNRP